MTNNQAGKLRVLYVLGSGHCGSTLLNLCLDKHPEIAGLGELGSVPADNQLPLDHPLWQSAAAHFEEATGKVLAEMSFTSPRYSTRALLRKPAAPKAWQDSNMAALSAIAQASEASWLADSSKFWQRLWALRATGGISVKVLYLVRDSRGVMNSYHRKDGHWTRGYRRMMKLDIIAWFLRNIRIGRKDWLTLNYEDFAREPEKALHRVCAFLDLTYDPGMCQPDPSRYSGVGGNRLRWSPVEKISLNESWRHQMARKTRLIVSLITLPYNIRHRYDLLP